VNQLSNVCSARRSLVAQAEPQLRRGSRRQRRESNVTTVTPSCPGRIVVHSSSRTLAPIWLPHWPPWMCTISRILSWGSGLQRNEMKRLKAAVEHPRQTSSRAQVTVHAQQQTRAMLHYRLTKAHAACARALAAQWRPSNKTSTGLPESARNRRTLAHARTLTQQRNAPGCKVSIQLSSSF